MEFDLDELIETARNYAPSIYKHDVVKALEELKADRVRIVELEAKFDEIEKQEPICYLKICPVYDNFGEVISNNKCYVQHVKNSPDSFPVYAIPIIKNEHSQVITDNSKALANALEKIAELEKKQQWQPIETAPKDGTEVLLFEKRERYIEDDFIDSYYIFSGAFREDSYQGACWECLEYDAFSHEPNHWMPLPTPPTVNQDE